MGKVPTRRPKAKKKKIKGPATPPALPPDGKYKKKKKKSGKMVRGFAAPGPPNPN
jgi:hypothetical protein